MTNRLNILPSPAPEKKPTLGISAEQGFDPVATPLAIQAKFDRLWLTEPEQFDPYRNCLERERIKRTWDLLQRRIEPAGKIAVDIGCGLGVLAKKLCDHGATTVHAVDVSNNALKAIKPPEGHNIKPIQACMPKTVLEDDFYDLVVSTELIAYLPPKEERLYFAELSRVVKPSGLVICSTSLDIDTDGALHRFAALAETEFQIIEWVFSYHALFLRISNFFKAPYRFAKGSKDPIYRKIEVNKRRSLGQKWFQFNTTPLVGKFWSFFQYFSNPFVTLLEKEPKILLWIESICRFFSAENGISHVMFIGKRHPIWLPTATELLAIEPKHKRQVWE